MDDSIVDISDGQNESFSNGTDADEDPGLYKFSTSEVVIVSIFYGLISLTAFIGNSLGQSKKIKKVISSNTQIIWIK